MKFSKLCVINTHFHELFEDFFVLKDYQTCQWVGNWSIYKKIQKDPNLELQWRTLIIDMRKTIRRDGYKLFKENMWNCKVENICWRALSTNQLIVTIKDRIRGQVKQSLVLWFIYHAGPDLSLGCSPGNSAPQWWPDPSAWISATHMGNLRAGLVSLRK